MEKRKNRRRKTVKDFVLLLCECFLCLCVSRNSMRRPQQTNVENKKRVLFKAKVRSCLNVNVETVSVMRQRKKKKKNFSAFLNYFARALSLSLSICFLNQFDEISKTKSLANQSSETTTRSRRRSLSNQK